MSWVQVVDSNGVPIRSSEDGSCARHVIGLAGVRLDPDPPGMLEAEQMIHHFEPFVPLGIINATDVNDSFELALGVIAEEGQDLHDGRGCNVNCEFILDHGKLLNVFRKALEEVRAINME